MNKLIVAPVVVAADILVLVHLALELHARKRSMGTQELEPEEFFQAMMALGEIIFAITAFALTVY